MEWIPAKLRTIRQEFKMTQLEMALASGLSQRDISQLETGRKEGLPREFIHFLHSKGVDLNWLFADPDAELPVTRETPAAPLKQYATEEPTATLAEEDRPVGYGASKPLARPAAAPTVRVVGKSALPDYARRRLDAAFEQSLPVWHLPLPEMQQGVFRVFQVADASMLPGFAPDDWVIARAESARHGLEEGAVYVVVATQGVYVQRLFTAPDQPAAVRLQPDAPGVASITLPSPDILELWVVKGRLSFHLPTGGMAAEQKVTTLEANLQDLLDRVQRLEQGR